MLLYRDAVTYRTGEKEMPAWSLTRWHRPQIPARQKTQQNIRTSFPVLLILGSWEVGPPLGCGLNAERWLSKHQSVGEVRVSRGKWRVQAVIRQLRKAERGQRSEKWGEMSFIDRRRQLHYRQSLDTRWIHKCTRVRALHKFYPHDKIVLVIVIRLP